MRNIKFNIICLSFFFLCFSSAFGQITNNGNDGPKTKYDVLKSPTYNLIFPREYRPEALKAAQFIDTVAPYVSYGIKAPYRKFPIILYTSDQLSNGLVSLVPSRGELVMTPPVSMSSTTMWYKQLILHEYRHVAQLSALQGGCLSYLKYFLGELAGSIGLAIVPLWVLEGDATDSETKLAEFGRGLQPSFTIEYRGMMTDEADKKFDKIYVDALVLGSYNRNIPDHYKFGYQMVNSFQRHVSGTYPGDLFDLASRRPYLITPNFVYTHKSGMGSTKKMARLTFAELDSIWRPTYMIPNSYNFLTSSGRSYTTYRHPIPTGEPGKYVVLKKTMDIPQSFFITDGKTEKLIFQPGSLSSRPVLVNGSLYWTEYKSDMFYEKRSTSIIKSFDILDGIERSFKRGESNYLITDYKEGWAMARYDSLLNANIVLSDYSFKDFDTIRFAKTTSLHGMAYDKKTDKIFFLAVDEDGMWLGGVDSEHRFDTLKAPSAVMLSDLRAGDGKLYYGSIQSGKDEIHSYNILTRKEYRQTTSKLGAKEPCADGDSIVFVGYSAKGWNVAKDKEEEIDSLEVGWQRIPKNILNPKQVPWQNPVPLESLKIDTAKVSQRPIKHFRRASKWFNFHSWIPGVAVDLEEFLGSFSLKSIGVGAIGMFQSPMGDFQGFVSAGSKESKFWTVGSIEYTGLPVKFALRGEYGGGSSKLYATGDVAKIRLKYDGSDYYSNLSASASLPMTLSSSAVSRVLTPAFYYLRTGDIMYNPVEETFVKGLDEWEASLAYSSLRTYSKRALMPRWGLYVKFGLRGVFHDEFSRILYSRIKLYLPGLYYNHTINVSASVQHQKVSTYNLDDKALEPTGITDKYIYENYHCAKVSYSMPVCYPDWGIDRYLFFRRLSVKFFYDYAIGAFPSSVSKSHNINYSFGTTIGLDISAFTSYNQNLQLCFACPNSNSFYFGFAYEFQINK